MQQRQPLPVSENMRFQERAWLAQRVGWAVLALVIVLALLGVFSNGILSTANAAREGVSLSVDYDRFQRRNAATHFAIHVPKQTEDEVWLRLGPSFQNSFDIESIQPQPARSGMGKNGLNLFFDAYDQDDLEIVIRARPRRIGAVKIEIARMPGLLRFPVIIYP